MEEARRFVAAADRVLTDPSPYLTAWRRGIIGYQAAPDVDGSALLELTWPLQAAERMLRFDHAVRRVDIAAFPAWRQLTAAQLADEELAETVPFVCAAAMHRDGRVRAVAVRLLAADAPRNLGALAVRCADPAPPVRAIAMAAVVPMLAAEAVREVVRQDLVLRAPQMRRLAPEVVDAAEAALLADPAATVAAMNGRAMNIAALLAKSERTRTRDLLECAGRHGPAFDVLWHAGIERATPLDALRLLEPNRNRLPSYPLVWLAAGRAWPGLDEAALSAPTLRRLRAQRVGQLLPLLTQGGRWPGAEPRDQVLRALLDPAAAPRRLAQKLLAHAGLDVAAYYRSLIDLSPTAVIGLGEVGSPADVPAITHHLTSPEPMFRYAAVNALKLDPDGYMPALLNALDDPDRRVAQTAAGRLRRRVAQAGVEPITAIGTRQIGPHAANVATYLLLQGPTEEILDRLLGDPDRLRNHRNFVLTVLSEWSRRNRPLPAHPPDPKQMEILTRLRERHANDAAVLDMLDLDRPDDRKPPGTNWIGAWHQHSGHLGTNGDDR